MSEYKMKLRNNRKKADQIKNKENIQQKEDIIQKSIKVLQKIFSSQKRKETSSHIKEQEKHSFEKQFQSQIFEYNSPQYKQQISLSNSNNLVQEKSNYQSEKQQSLQKKFPQLFQSIERQSKSPIEGQYELLNKSQHSSIETRVLNIINQKQQNKIKFFNNKTLFIILIITFILILLISQIYFKNTQRQQVSFSQIQKKNDYNIHECEKITLEIFSQIVKILNTQGKINISDLKVRIFDFFESPYSEIIWVDLNTMKNDYENFKIFTKNDKNEIFWLNQKQYYNL